MKSKILLIIVFLLDFLLVDSQTIYVSTKGNDEWEGTEKYPVLTLERAKELVRSYDRDINVEVILEDGVYYLSNTIKFTSEDSKNFPASVTYKARHAGKVVISGGTKINVDWVKGENNIYTAKVLSEDYIDQLYVNGVRQRMARFPNPVEESGKNVYDTWKLNKRVKPDKTMDPLQPSLIQKWKNPKGGYLHAMHRALWGDMHWFINAKKNDGTLDLIGGWQNNRPASMHNLYRYVENIKEELDSPGEWYYSKDEQLLYYMPIDTMDLENSKIEIVRLKHLIEFSGSKENPVKGIKLEGLVFKHAARTFMDNKEPLLRSDWTIYRGGAVMFTGAEDCVINGCEFDNVGGNTIFVNNYNKRIKIQSCYIHGSGANGIAFVGDSKMVRSPLFRYGPQNYEDLDRNVGAKGDNYPQDCSVFDCLITSTGRYEKQTAPIHISMSQRIHVSHCSIYDVPRAGININEGTFGGHIIEFCDVFNTVLETGDHGSFNSWGRDRFWSSDPKIMSKMNEQNPHMRYWDILEPNILRYNRWRCDHGWDIDLDDGSSFYRIYCNVLLNGGLKLREGYDRVVTNNIIINNSLHPHVWFRNSGDVFKHNIVFKSYQPAGMTRTLEPNEKWGKEIDYNFFVTSIYEMKKFEGNCTDSHSINGNLLFNNPNNGDYTINGESEVFDIGYYNFSMNDFGVVSDKLKKISKTPCFPNLKIDLYSKIKGKSGYIWKGAMLEDIKGDRLSAYGVDFGSSGVALEYVPENSEASKLGFKTGDLIIMIDDKKVVNILKFRECVEGKPIKKIYKILVVRNQSEKELFVNSDDIYSDKFK